MNNALHIIKDWAIVTVPRVGSHYLQERIFVHTKALVLKYHEPKPQTWGYANSGILDNNARFWTGLQTDKLKIMTIVRDPKDLLVSDITMGIKQKYKNFNFTEVSSLEIEKIKNMADKYCNDYIQLESLSSIIIDYDQLISSPFEVTCFIADNLGVKIITNEYVTNLKNNEKSGYMVSSKNIPQYNVVAEAIDKVDLSNFYKAYNTIRSKCISVEKKCFI